MTTDASFSRDVLPGIDDCWNRIGVKGDGSCPKLEEVVHCRNCPVYAAVGQQLFEREPPADYVEQRTQQLAADDQRAVADTVAVVVFRLGEEWLAMDVGDVIEVAQPRVIRRVPHRTSQLLLGLVNIRGQLELCVALGYLLGIEPAAGDAQTAKNRPTDRLLVAEYQERRWVFAVNEVAGVRRVEVEAIGSVPATVTGGRRHFSRGVFSWEDKRVGYLGKDRLFESLEGSIP